MDEEPQRQNSFLSISNIANTTLFLQVSLAYIVIRDISFTYLNFEF